MVGLYQMFFFWGCINDPLYHTGTSWYCASIIMIRIIQVVLLGVKPAVVSRVGEQLAGAGQGGQHLFLDLNLRTWCYASLSHSPPSPTQPRPNLSSFLCFIDKVGNIYFLTNFSSFGGFIDKVDNIYFLSNFVKFWGFYRHLGPKQEIPHTITI